MAPGAYTQAHLASECAASCSTSAFCTGKLACSCGSCQQTNTAFVPNEPNGYVQDMLMLGTGFVPNDVQWPITMKITNLVYEKQVKSGTKFTSSDLPSQDIYFIYSEVDSDKGGGDLSESAGSAINPSLLTSLVVVAATMLAVARAKGPFC